MQNFVIVDKIDHWCLEVDNVHVITSKDYLMDSSFAKERHIRLLNLSRSYKYQSLGYYVSLLAEARGHRVFPSVQTLQDLKSPTMIRIVSDELDRLIQKSLSPLKSKKFELSIYFGKNVAKQYEKLALQIYNLFQSPLLRAKFVFTDKWLLQDISTIALKDVPDAHQQDLMNFASQYFTKSHHHKKNKNSAGYDLAILYNPNEKFSPSNQRAIRKFESAARQVGLKPQLISKNDFNKIPFFDALFIRETTAVNHYTYKFSGRAEKEGLVVLDDPESIIKCTNKVYLAELFAKSKVLMPKTEVLHKDNAGLISSSLGFPCVLKLPDGSFSKSVVKIEDEKNLDVALKEYFPLSSLLIAQEFMPTEFDWRIGILNNAVIFACKYFMVKKHWQIYHWNQPTKLSTGNFETVALEMVPPVVLQTALKAAKLVGSGLYGIDLKQVDNKAYVIEVNDNPNIDSGIEDQILGKELYLKIMEYFIHQIEERKRRT